MIEFAASGYGLALGLILLNVMFVIGSVAIFKGK